jgi:hypothetical protein
MFLDDMASVLVTAGVGTLGVDLFLSSKAVIPSGTGPYITLTETGGMGVGGFRGEGGRVQNKARSSTVRPGAQVLVRASSYNTARSKSNAALDALDGLWNTKINGVAYLSVTARQEPTDAGVDEAGRAVVVFNIDCEKQPT